jgi:hypothetical protein
MAWRAGGGVAGKAAGIASAKSTAARRTGVRALRAHAARENVDNKGVSK